MFKARKWWALGLTATMIMGTMAGCSSGSGETKGTSGGGDPAANTENGSTDSGQTSGNSGAAGNEEASFEKKLRKSMREKLKYGRGVNLRYRHWRKILMRFIPM